MDRQLQKQPEGATAKRVFLKEEKGPRTPEGTLLVPPGSCKSDLLGKDDSVCCFQVGMQWRVKSASTSKTFSISHLPCIQFLQKKMHTYYVPGFVLSTWNTVANKSVWPLPSQRFQSRGGNPYKNEETADKYRITNDIIYNKFYKVNR